MRRIAMFLGVFLAGTGALTAQTSQFGVRGLGFPGRGGLTAKALSTGGALGMFEGESSRNPAALSLLITTTSVFNATTGWQSSTNPIRDNSTRNTRFPQLSVAGPVPGSPFSVGFSHSLFTDRDFTIVSGGLATPRGEPVFYTDSLAARGGISDMRLTVAWHPVGKFALGAGIDFLTGQNQITTRRVWEDTLYLATRVGGEISYRATGFTVGGLYQPSPRLQFAVSAQRLGALEVRQDSLDERRKVPLPMTLTAAVRAQLLPAVHLSGMVTSRNWDRGNDALLASGSTGAQSTMEFAGGIELTRNRRVPDQLPLRLGFRQADLPFPMVPGATPRETAFSVGSGFRFANQGGGVDFTLERASRKEETGYTERAWLFSIGMTVRTSGGGR